MSLGRVTLSRTSNVLRASRLGTSLSNVGASPITFSRSTSAAAAKKKLEDKWKGLSKEEQSQKYLEMMERVQLPTSIDHTRVLVPVLDHSVPTPISKRSSDQGTLAWLKERANQKFQNAFHLQAVGRSPTFLCLPNAEPPNRAWSTQIFSTESLSDNSWLAPLRTHALERYILMNEAQAKGDVKALRTICADSQLREVTRRVESRSKDLVYAWKYHGENSPTQCISIRTVPDEVERSHLTVIQAALKFDTLQSVAVYNKKTGKLLHEQGTPENPSKVVEYLVLEKQTKHDGPWMIRTQLHEGVSGEMENLF